MAITLNGTDLFGFNALQQAAIRRLVKYLEDADAAGATTFPDIPESMLFAFELFDRRSLVTALKWAWENQSDAGELRNSLLYPGMPPVAQKSLVTTVNKKLRKGELGLPDNRNLLTYSSSLANAVWTKSNLTIADNAVASFDVSNTGSRVTITLNDWTDLRRNVAGLSLLPDKWYTISVYAKPVSTLFVEMGFNSRASDFSKSFTAASSFDPNTRKHSTRGNAWIGEGGDYDYPHRQHALVLLPNGWVRLVNSFKTPTDLAAYNVREIFLYTESDVPNQAGAIMHYGGWQLEAGKVATNYQRVDATPVG